MRDFTVYDMIRRNAAVYADQTALVCGDQRFSFAEVLKQVDALAEGLKQQNIGKGDRIAVLACNCHYWFFLFGAAAARGAIIVGINWRLSQDEIRHILEDSAPAALCCDLQHAGTVNELVNTCGYSGKVFGFASSGTPGIPFDHLFVENAVPSDCEVSSDDPFCIIYTAAVEGKSRGAVLTHGNIISANLQTIATMGLSFRDAHLNILPLFHITGLNLALCIMHAGGKNVVMDRFDAEKALQWADQESISVIGSFPPILSTLQTAMETHGYSLSSLRHILGIDQPDAIRSFESRTQSVFWILYGQTETSGLVSFSPALEKPGSAGKQGALITLRIVDDQDQPVPAGQPGEIAVQGPLVFQGFWNQAEYNRHIFRNGWHHTGDLGRLDAEGYLWFAGRKPEKELIKPGGENVYPSEVESVIREHPAVAAVSVIGVPDPKFGEGVKAVCVLKPGAVLTAEEIREFVASRIARYKKPGYVEFVDALPMTGAGTVDRAKVKQMYGS